ncbi:MAG: mechanosensitive ion channel, partial [Gammaproteobacteria bacterium]|nr:mechanosensitive ion channel [Gammaproteobacteria bacterium]
VGDWIQSPDRNIEGNVEHIGWRLTRIRTLDKRPLYVPNGIFSTIVIENVTRMSHRQINVMVGVRYDDAKVIEPITKAIEEMLRQHPGVDQTQSVFAHLMQFADSSLNINVYCFTKATDSAKFRPVQQDIFLKIIAIIAKHGAECAFPTTTLYVANYDNNRSNQTT